MQAIESQAFQKHIFAGISIIIGLDFGIIVLYLKISLLAYMYQGGSVLIFAWFLIHYDI